MKFGVSANLEYDVRSSSTLILNIHALKTANQTVLNETLTITPHIKTDELISLNGESRFIRLEILEKCTVNIAYNATVDSCVKITDYKELEEIKIVDMDISVLPYLYPSRYCQSDKLYRLAYTKFGHITNPFEQVIALTDWIHQNVEYLSGSTNAQTSAYDTIAEQAGVCRDFAHLGIALCRALTIPARYFTGYAYQLKPADFHACFEAYLSGQWVIFDASKLTPLNGLIKIATGRDAADTAVANLFGDIEFTSMSVDCQLLDEKFEPFYYEPSAFNGLTYL